MEPVALKSRTEPDFPRRQGSCSLLPRMPGQGNKCSAPHLPAAPPWVTPTFPARGQLHPALLGPRAWRRAELGVSWAQSLCTGLSRAAAGASSRLGEQLPPEQHSLLPTGQHFLGRGESEQRLQGDFKYSSRSGRNIYPPACSNMLHFLTL